MKPAELERLETTHANMAAFLGTRAEGFEASFPEEIEILRAPAAGDHLGELCCDVMDLEEWEPGDLMALSAAAFLLAVHIQIASEGDENGTEESRTHRSDHDQGGR